jgi:hypothetical protein
MKPVILAAAVLALSAPAALAAGTPKQAASVPDAVKTYVQHNSGDPVLYSAGIQVGESLRAVDAGEVWRQVPDYPQYSWSNLGGQLVVVDNQTKKVAAVY